MSKWELQGLRISQTWSKSTYGWQNITDVRFYVKRGSNLNDEHNYGNYSTSMFENISKCSIDGLLEYVYE